MTAGSRLHSLASLIWWLGVDPSIEHVPTDVWRREVRVPGELGPSRVALYGPTSGRILGGYFVIPGMHYEGPSDPRMARFLSVLASSGFLVYAPYLDDPLRLRVTARSLEQCFAAFRHFLEQPSLPAGCRPTVFSISYGSLFGFRVASHPEFRDRVGRLFVFGGYADWATSLRYALTGYVGDEKIGEHDPLNRAVMYINVAERLVADEADRARLCQAWELFVRRTWGREEMKKGGYRTVAHQLAEGLPEHLRGLYVEGCGVGPADPKLLSTSVEQAGEMGAFLDPRPHLLDIRCPVHLAHGRDDDVIPYTQLAEIEAGLPTGLARKYLTGLYGHATNVSVLGQLENLPLLFEELLTLGSMAWALHEAD